MQGSQGQFASNWPEERVSIKFDNDRHCWT